jgi:hypothetical protein
MPRAAPYYEGIYSSMIEENFLLQAITRPFTIFYRGYTLHKALRE